MTENYYNKLLNITDDIDDVGESNTRINELYDIASNVLKDDFDCTQNNCREFRLLKEFKDTVEATAKKEKTLMLSVGVQDVVSIYIINTYLPNQRKKSFCNKSVWVLDEYVSDITSQLNKHYFYEAEEWLLDNGHKKHKNWMKMNREFKKLAPEEITETPDRLLFFHSLMNILGHHKDFTLLKEKQSVLAYTISGLIN